MNESLARAKELSEEAQEGEFGLAKNRARCPSELFARRMGGTYEARSEKLMIVMLTCGDLSRKSSSFLILGDKTIGSRTITNIVLSS